MAGRLPKMLRHSGALREPQCPKFQLAAEALEASGNVKSVEFQEAGCAYFWLDFFVNFFHQGKKLVESQNLPLLSLPAMQRK
jgi:hypothetical protein